MVSKAFVSSFPEDSPRREMRVSVNMITDEALPGQLGLLAPLVASRLAGDPGAAHAVYDLYAGPSHSTPPETYSAPSAFAVKVRNPLEFTYPIDIPRIEGAISFNVFEIASLSVDAKGQQDEETWSCGLFMLPSLFNHSCSPNTHRFFFGDVMVIRATCDVSKGDELLMTYTGHDPHSETDPLRQRRLAKWFKTCQCSLCDSDRSDGEIACNTRLQLLRQAKTWTTVEAARAGIKRIEKTYMFIPDGDSFPLSVAHAQLAIAHSYTGNMVACAKAFMQSLKYLGTKVDDKSTSGRCSPGLPISQLPETHARHSGYTHYIIITCLRLADTFGSLDDPIRQLNWQQAASWCTSF